MKKEAIEEIAYTIALSMVPGIGNIIARKLLSYYGSAKRVFISPKGKLENTPLIGKKISEAIKNFKNFERVYEQVNQAKRNHVQLLLLDDEKYPYRLKNIHDPPILLYYKGNINLNASRVITIVGTRKATHYGKSFIQRLIKDFSKYTNLIIVSGLAYGIDIQVHKESLNCRIPTIAVVAHGLDKIYPYEHKNIAHHMINQGGILSEYTFGTDPEANHFPNRNRILAGISDATIVVESALKGGALITARLANDYSREVFALPGSIRNPYSEGCHKLIKRNQAHLMTNLEDLEYIMQWENQSISTSSSKIITGIENLKGKQKQIAQVIQESENIHIDALATKVNLAIDTLLSTLLELEIKGIVKTLPGKRYILT